MVEKQTSSKEEKPKAQDQEQPVLSNKEQLKQEQEKNANELYDIINDIKEVTQEAIDTVEGELKDRKLSKKYRQDVNKWLRDANAVLKEQKKKPKREPRGQKARDVSMKEIRNDVKETIIKLKKYADQTIEQKEKRNKDIECKIDFAASFEVSTY